MLTVLRDVNNIKIQGNSINSSKMSESISFIKLIVLSCAIFLLVNEVSLEEVVSSRPHMNSSMGGNSTPHQSIMFGNMSTMLHLNQAQQAVSANMTARDVNNSNDNSSIIRAHMMSNQKSSISGQTQATKTNSGSSSTKASSTATQNRASQATTHSPAVNSRLKQTNPIGISGSSNGRKQSEMSTEGTRDSQSFVTINSNPTSVQVNNIADPSRASPNKQSSSSVGIQPARPVSVGYNSKTNADHGSLVWPNQQSSSKVTQWRARTGPQANASPHFVAQSLEHNLHQHQSYLNPHESLIEPPSTSSDPLQLEKPNGYSYGESSELYTHTSPMSPVRQEISSLNQATNRAKGSSQSIYISSIPSSISNDHRTGHSRFDASKPHQQQVIMSSGPIQFEQQALFNDVQRELRFNSPTSMATNQAGSSASGLSPCKPIGLGLHQDLVQSNIQVSGEPKYLRAGDGTRLRSQYIFKVIRADSLTDCELACSRASSLAGNNQQDACKSFNYRPYFAAENCELSRLDLKSLKLNDGAQFEQHTQFDFYALDWTATSSGLQSYGALNDQDCVDVSQSCSQDGMEFTLRSNEPFNGRIYTYGFYDSCYVDGDGSTTNVLKITRSNGFPRCGTQQIGDLMTNIVVVQYSDFVQTTRDRKYNLTCYFSGPGEAVVTSNYLDTKVDERSHPIQIEHLPPQNVITSNVHLRVLYRGQPTNTIAVGDLLTFRLETKSIGGQRMRLEQAGTSSQTEIFATNVIAKDPYSGRQVQLIDHRGCPVDPVNVFPELQRTPDGSLESEFYAFKIPDSNFLIFQATVRTCRAPCEPVICQSPTHGQNENPSKSQYQLLPTGTLSSGIKGGTLIPSSSLGFTGNSFAPAPSWGRRKRRRREAILEDNIDNDETLNVGESIEHVIPARLTPVIGSRSDVAQDNQLPGMLTFRRPELSEAEEEVKEMFRVYMSRAELDRKANRDKVDSSEISQRIRQKPQQQDIDRMMNLSLSDVNHQSATRSSETLASFYSDPEQICLSLSGYYIMLFSVVALSMVLLSIISVSWFVTKRRKLYFSDPIADAMY